MTDTMWETEPDGPGSGDDRYGVHPGQEQAVELATSLGHTVESDPPFFSSTERWTCTACGMAVIKCGSNIYGSASEETCPPQE